MEKRQKYDPRKAIEEEKKKKMMMKSEVIEPRKEP